MAKKKVESLKVEELQSKLVDLKKEQMNQRFQHAAGQMPKTPNIVFVAGRVLACMANCL